MPFSMEWLRKLDDWLAFAEKALLVFLFSSLVLLISFNIITRNLFNYSFQLILEAAPGIVLWLALLGSTLALKQNRHIKLEILLRYLGRQARNFARVFGSMTGLTVMGVLFIASIEFVKNEIQIFGPGGWVSIVIPLFFALASFRYALQAVNVFRSAGSRVKTK
jgi:TRAP-type C4-dicarboxylate transport system permease small subunit